MRRSSAPRVVTFEFVASHGREPRGRGYWGFYFGHGRSGTCVDPWFAPGERTYSDARRLAVAEARSRGFTTVSVGP